MFIRVEVSGEETLKLKLGKIASIAASKLKGAVYLWKDYFAASIRKELSGKSLQRRTSLLHNMMGNPNSLVIVQTDDTSFVIKYKGAIVPYAVAHETGKTITAKGKFLAIPLKQAGRGEGTKPLSDYKKTFLRKSKNKPGYTVFENSGGKIVPIFVLRKSIKLEKREWFAKAAENAAPILSRLIQKMSKEIVAT